MTHAPVQIDQWLDTFPVRTERLQHAMVAVLHETLGQTVRATDIERAFDFGMSMASRLSRSAFSDNPREMSLLLPGRPTMLRFIGRAEQLSCKGKLVAELRDSYEDFFAHVSQVASSHQELSSLLSAHDPELLRESEERRRATFFRAAADLHGGYADAVSCVFLFKPNAEDDRLGDHVYVHQYHRLRRLGVMRTIVVSCGASEASETGDRSSRRLDGQTVNPFEDGFLVKELSSPQLPRLRSINTGKVVRQVYLSDDLPLGVAIDFGMVSAHVKWTKNIRSVESGTEQSIVTLRVPCKSLLADFLIHKDMWPGIEPVLKLYDNNDPDDDQYPEDHWYEEIPNFDVLEPISPNHMLLPPNEAPKHADAVRYLVRDGKIELNDYRAYRLVTRYPVAGRSIWAFFSRHPDDTHSTD